MDDYTIIIHIRTVWGVAFMTELLHYLYQFLLEHRFESALHQERAAYEDSLRMCDRASQRLAEQLSSAQREEMEKLIDGREELQSLELEAMFRCAPGLGLELGQLSK